MPVHYYDNVADSYALARPQYPGALFDFILSLCQKRELAWDCCCGSGQSSIALAKYFNRVHATDISTQQIKQAPEHQCITYRVEPAESCSLEDHSVDLLCVATAYHWLDQSQFAVEAKRVLNDNGLIAVWSYMMPTSSEPLLNQIIEESFDLLTPYMPPKVAFAKQKYQTIYFPFQEIKSPSFTINQLCTLQEFKLLFDTFAAANFYRERHGYGVIERFSNKLDELWGLSDSKKLLQWEVFTRVGIKR